MPPPKIEAIQVTLPPCHSHGDDDLVEPGRGGLGEAPDEEDDRLDAGAIRRLDDPIGALGGERERLFEQEVAAPFGRPAREVDLDVRRHGDRDRVHHVEDRVEVGLGRCTVSPGDRLGLDGVATPDRDEIDLGVRREARGVNGVSPVPRAEHGKAHGSADQCRFGCLRRLDVGKAGHAEAVDEAEEPGDQGHDRARSAARSASPRC